jgi:uncharacterized protein YjbI with pentapeptide repeats
MIENLEEESRLTIRNQSFLNENNLEKYVKWDAFPGIIFLDCTFEDINLLARVFGSCDLKNCNFNNVNFRKCQFSACQFENCQIVNSDLTRADFSNTSFRNCNFLEVNLRASDFMHCEFRETKFSKSNLYLIGVWDVKVWKSNEWIEIKESSNFEKILKDMNLILE